MDCVISVYGFSGGVAKGSEEGAGVSIRDLAKEVARVLKPGGTVLFIEKGQVPELVREIFSFATKRSASRLPRGIELR